MILGQKISGGASWSRDDDIAFERALTIYTNENDQNRWEKIAAVVPGKTLEQIIEHYEILVRDVLMIESGCVPLPDYDFSKRTNHNTSEEERRIWEGGKDRRCEYQKCKSKLKQKRRKGVPWTAYEHRQFLLGLDEYGRGDWRSISRNFVVTRTPTQVASHAQKYYARINSKNKNKNRTSIHDIAVGESRSILTKQRPTTWQNNNINVASSSNTQATSQPSLDLPICDGTPSIWNTQAISQPSLDLPMYGTPTMWNMQAAAQPSVNIPMHGQSMVGPMLLPSGNDMNRLAQPHMAYGVQQHSVPYSSVSSAPTNMDSIPYNMTYIPQSRI